MTPSIIKVSGPTVVAKGMRKTQMFNRVRIGHAGLLGEVIRLQGEDATIQVYEDTIGLKLGEPVEDTGEPLQVELGPGLLGSLFDGVQRPLDVMSTQQGAWLTRGVSIPAISRDRRWEFTPLVQPGDKVCGGDSLGVVQETQRLQHHILVPPGISGVITASDKGTFTVTDTIAVLETGESLSMLQKWPVRQPRPVRQRRPPSVPFITGQRVLDTLFPIASGGTVIIPGGFGTGKTVVEQNLAKYAQAQVIIYIGCGERGNEIADVLAEFPQLTDPETGHPLMERTILIVNTSNMPVAAREASIYTGVTIAEYYRDMGYAVAVMADSLSRWAEAIREISARMEEMPGEEGYPTYLPTKLAGFYERSGRVQCLGSEDREGVVTIVSAISPPGGDFSEPVTQSAMQMAGGLWALDADLAHRRHFPAINWKQSFSLYIAGLDSWFQQEVAADWPTLRENLSSLLQKEEEIQEVAQLVGSDALPEQERLTLEIGRFIREDYLRQNAFSETDGTCPLEKQYWMLKAFFQFLQYCEDGLTKGKSLEELLDSPIKHELARIKDAAFEVSVHQAKALIETMRTELARIESREG